MSNYDPRNWYWSVAGSTTQVYSSASGDYVAIADSTYQAWLAAGNAPTKIDTEANLGDVLAPYSIRPVNAAVLDGYQNSQAAKLTVEVVAKVAFNHENRIRALEGHRTREPVRVCSATELADSLTASSMGSWGPSS